MRKHIYQILELAKFDDRAGRWFDIFIVILISGNILAIILESVDWVYARYDDWFFWFEVFSVAVFTVEYLLRVWSCVENPSSRYSRAVTGRLRFAVTPLAVVDLLAILPFYLGMLVSIDLRFLRALRLVRIFKLTRYSASMTLLLKVLRDEAQSFGAAFFILIIIMIFASSGIYLFEHKAQPEAFRNIPQAVWWSVATLTTVGYGDVIPITAGGKIFGIVIMIIGIGMVALPAGILASAFSEQMRLRRMEYEGLAQAVLEDGRITPNEQMEMACARTALGLNEEDAKKIFAHIAREEFHKKGVCPHCQKSLHNRRSGDK
jgi:voltage-gated potassium channel